MTGPGRRKAVTGGLTMVESVVLEWNAGRGILQMRGKRLAKGVKWMFGVKSGL